MKRDISVLGIGIAALTLGWTAVVGAEEKLVVAMKPASVDRDLARYVAAVGKPMTVDAKAGVTVGDLVRGHCGNVDEDYLALLKAANPTLAMPDWKSDTLLAEPKTVEMPACIRFSSFASQQSKDANTWSEILLKDAKARMSMLAEIWKRQPNATEEVSDEVKLYSNVSKAQLGDACAEAKTIVPAFDTVELLQVIASNNRHMSPLTRGMPVVVMVPDTGLYTNDAMPFPIHRVDRLGWTRSPLDHDEGIAPHETMAERQHGTQVASIALGGPELIGLLDSLDIRLRLAPVNIMETNGSIGLTSLNSAIDIADNMNAVVNLSVGRRVPISEVTNALKERSDVLFVVAAGNEGKSLLDTRVYPALHGGREGNSNLITVAALDANGKALANFSNYDARYVDIAAPGCMQPAYEKNDDSGYRVVKVSGTSFAAPHVSFTAALLRAMWPSAVPRRIKSRILSGADLEPSLATKVADSRKLNVVKALAIYQDVVEAKVDGSKKRIRGHLVSPSDPLLLCGETLKLSRSFVPGRNTVRRIARLEGPNARTLVDWEDRDGRFLTNVCDAEELPVRIVEEDTGTMHQIASSDVIDIVFAETR